MIADSKLDIDLAIQRKLYDRGYDPEQIQAVPRRDRWRIYEEVKQLVGQNCHSLDEYETLILQAAEKLKL